MTNRLENQIYSPDLLKFYLHLGKRGYTYPLGLRQKACQMIDPRLMSSANVQIHLP